MNAHSCFRLYIRLYIRLRSLHPREKFRNFNSLPLQSPFTQKLGIFAGEFLTPNADVSVLVFTPGESRHGLSRHTKLERNVLLDTSKKIRNIRSFSLTAKDITFFTNYML
jgi:hypothetical protein